jgi:amino acid transporter
MNEHSTAQNRKKLSLTGSVALGTGVMIGAGIFALVGQVAELAGAGCLGRSSPGP